MSGGAWGYLAHALRETAEGEGEAQRRVKACLLVLAEIEHHLDWGVCGDTCSECAEARVLSALYAFFDDHALDETKAVEILNSGKPQCSECTEARKRSEMYLRLEALTKENEEERG